MGDNNLILSHRLSEYSSKGPFLEEDIAISNVSLDLLGQAESFLAYASEIKGSGSANDLAFRRPEHEYVNVQMVELPNMDFGVLMAKQFYMDVYHYLLYTEMKSSRDDKLRAIAEKSLKEVTYHLRRSSSWVKRLGDGTSESHRRIQEALDDLWLYTGELFEQDEVEMELTSQGILPEMSSLQSKWLKMVSEIMLEATLKVSDNTFSHTGGRKGQHTEFLGHILTDMQYLNRAYPDANW